MRCLIKIINPQDQADAAEHFLKGEGGALRQLKRMITGNISACLRGPVNWGAEKKQGSWTTWQGLAQQQEIEKPRVYSVDLVLIAPALSLPR